MERTARNVCAALLTALLLSSQSTFSDPVRLDNVESHPNAFDARVVAAANDWLQRYAGYEAKRQRVLEPAAVVLSTVRRAALKHLVQRDPEAAWNLSLSPVQRLGLPQSVVGLLEDRVHTSGDLVAAITELGDLSAGQGGFPPDPIDAWTVRLGDTTLQARVYGNHRNHQTKFDIPIHGIVIDELIAVSDQLLYRYDDWETLLLGFKPGQIVATSGGLPIVLPDLETFADLEDELLERLLRFGPLFMPANDNPWSSGPKRVLMLKVMFRGDPREPPYDDSDIAAWFGNVQRFFNENSQRRTTLFPTIVSAPLTVLESSAYTSASSEGTGMAILADQAVQAARAEGYDPDAYDRIVILTPQLFDDPAARGEIGGKVVTITGARTDLGVTMTHELGHTYGFPHSSFHRAFGFDPLGPGEDLEYGDVWDMMGSPTLDMTAENREARHFNAFYKTFAGWLPSSAVVDATLGGDFLLRPHDAAGPTGIRAIFIEAGDGSVYWIGKRSRFPWNPSMTDGIEIRRVNNVTPSSFGPVLLFDLDPEGSTILHSLTPVRTFTDTANSISVRAVFSGEDATGPFTRVFITR